MIVKPHTATKIKIRDKVFFTWDKMDPRKEAFLRGVRKDIRNEPDDTWMRGKMTGHGHEFEMDMLLSENPRVIP